MSETVKAASPGTATQLLTTPTPATQATAGSSAGGSSTGSTILLQTPPPALSALSAGQIIRAVAAGRTADGKTLLDTRFGQLALELPILAGRGQVLRLQIVHAGLPLELRLLSAQDGEDGARPMSFSALRPGDTLRGQFQPGAGGAQAQGATAAVAAGIRLNLRLLSLGAPGKTSASANDPLLLTGTVTGSARGGGTLVGTATGTLLLPGVTDAPKGSRITLQILATPGTVLPPTAAGAQALSLSALTHGWPALQEAIDAVHAADPGRAAAIVSASLPTTGPQLAAGMAFFLNAVFGAKMQDWLGRDLLRALETQQRGDLASRLADDFAELARLSQDSFGAEWRTVMLPVLHDGVLQQIRLYLRAHADDSESGGTPGDEDAGTRFIVEVELSQLGALQLDGLVRPNRFDLMVRTHRALPATVRDEIGALFAAANAGMKAAGQIGFQVGRDFPVSPLESASVHTVGVFA
jgi:hypothetical protein